MNSRLFILPKPVKIGGSSSNRSVCDGNQSMVKVYRQPKSLPLHTSDASNASTNGEANHQSGQGSEGDGFEPDHGDTPPIIRPYLQIMFTDRTDHHGLEGCLAMAGKAGASLRQLGISDEGSESDEDKDKAESSHRSPRPSPHEYANEGDDRSSDESSERDAKWVFRISHVVLD